MLSISEAYQLASQHHRAGRLQQAEGIYRQIIQAVPNHAEAIHHLGLIAHQTGHGAPAEQLIRRSIQLSPTVAYYRKNLAEVLRAEGKFQEAIESYRQAAALAPGDADAFHGIGVAFDKLDRLEEAIEAYQKALAFRPIFAPAHFNLGVAIEKLGRYREALAHFDRAIQLKSDYALARTARATSLLRMGRLEEGWKEYEWRWKLEWMADRRPLPNVPVWSGTELSGRRILLRAEQGMGDTIHAARYVPMVVERGGKVILEVQGPLKRLMEKMAEVITIGEKLPEFDVQAPLLSLPGILGTAMENIPAPVPYLSGTSTIESDALKVGLVWSGSVNPMARHRAVPLHMLAPLARVQGVEFYSLQKGEPSAEIANAPLELIDKTAGLADFADTADLIAGLDLVIAVDTAVAHLAGAMGKKTWVLLPAVSDFRWFIDRQDSPWYPTMRLYRQQVRGDWTGVIARVAVDLEEMAVR